MTQYKHARDYRVSSQEHAPELNVSRDRLIRNEYDLPQESWYSLEQRRAVFSGLASVDTNWKVAPRPATPENFNIISRPVSRQNASAFQRLQLNNHREMTVQIQRYGIESWAQHYENASDFEVQQQLRDSRGEAMHPVLRAALEEHFGQSLPEILIHTDEAANEQAEQLGAIAFTRGSSIYFKSGHFEPFSLEGFKLLVHETTHVIQQAQGIVPEGVDTSSSLEREAQVEAGKISSAPSQKAKLEKPAQYAAHLKKLLTDTENPALRFEVVVREFEAVPLELQAKTRILLMQGFNPRSSEYGRLEGSLVVAKPIPVNQNVRFGVARESKNLETGFNENMFNTPKPNLEIQNVLESLAQINVPGMSRKPNSGRTGATQSRHVTSRSIQRQGNPGNEEPIGKTAFVREEGLNLREKPNTDGKGTPLKFGTRVFVVSKAAGGWLKVLVGGSKTGYVRAASIHGLSPEYQAMLQKDPGLQLFRVQDKESGWNLVKRAYKIQGNEDAKDQGIYHFLNAIRAVNNPSMFKIVMEGNAVQKVGGSFKNWVGDKFGAGLDADNVQLQQGDLWIPSFTVAAKMDVGSGTMGGEASRLYKKIDQKIKDFQTAYQLSKAVFPQVFAQRLGEGAKELIEGLITSMLVAAGVLITTSAIGALIGAFFGGVGAAPGALLGFELGMWVLEWLGLGFLAVWAGSKLGQVFSALGTFVNKVWNANGDQEALLQAGVSLADSMAILSVAVLQVLVTIGLAKGIGYLASKLSNSSFAGKVGLPKLTRYIESQMNKAQEGIKSNPTTAKIQEGARVTSPKVVANRIKTRVSKIPLGMKQAEFAKFSSDVRAQVSNFGSDVRVQGSRSSGTAKPTSDIDLAIRVPEQQFNQILAERFKNPNPGSAKWKTMQRAIETGKIQRGELGLSGFGKSLEKTYGFEVDISVIKINGIFDKGPWIKLW